MEDGKNGYILLLTESRWMPVLGMLSHYFLYLAYVVGTTHLR